MSSDPIETIAQYRPSESDLDAQWAPADRAAVVDDIVGTRRRSHWRRTSIIGAAGIAAAGIAAAAVVVAVLPGGGTPDRGPSTHAPPAKLAAVTLALHHLSAVAARVPNDVGDGRYWHMRIREQQAGPEGQRDSVTTLESWTDHTGRVWRHDVLTMDGLPPEVDYYEFAPGDDRVNYPSPAYLETLPTDPGALYDVLDSQVSGSATHEEAIFVAVGDMLRGGFAPPELRSAAIQVLTMLPHVSLSDTTTDSLGRTIQQFDFVDETARPGTVASVSFDPETAQILDEGLSDHSGGTIVQDGPSGRRVLSSDMDFTSSVVVADTVDQIPADVLDNAVLQHG